MPTVLEWVQRLEEKIQRQCWYAQPFEVRYRNEFVLPFLMAEYREVYGTRVDSITPQLRPPRTGTAAISVDSLIERMTVTGAEVVGDDIDSRRAVQLVQEAWEDSDLDVMHREAHREAGIKARSFAQVTRSQDGRAVASVESAEQMAVHREQAPPYDVDAALKVWSDEWTGDLFARLQLPGRDVRLRRGDMVRPDPEGSEVQSSWVVTADESTRLLGVPVVEFAWRSRLTVEPSSEIDRIQTLVDIADLIEGLMVFAGHFGAVPIRFGTGLAIPRDPKDPTGKTPLLDRDGKPALGFKPRADHFWVSTEKDARFGQLTPAGLDSFVAWAEHVSERLRAQTSVPASYYGVAPRSHMNAELLKTDEAPMIRRVTAMGRDGALGQGWRRLMRFILAIEDPASRARVRPRFADPETRVEAQATDSFQKVVASGVGVRAAAEKVLGWDPEFVRRAVDEAEAADPMLERLSRELTGELGAAPVGS